jgi:hypothetical protein
MESTPRRAAMEEPNVRSMILGLLTATALACPAPALAAPEGRQLADRVFLRLAESPSLAMADIRVTADRQTVTLAGAVPSEEARRRAVWLAGTTPGVRDVRDQLSVDPAAARARLEEVSDRDLARQVAKKLATETFPGARAREAWLFGWKVERPAGDLDFDVYVDGGQVTLAGRVPAASDLPEAVRTVRTVPGVRSIRSSLSFEERAADASRQARRPGPQERSESRQPITPDDLRKYAEAMARLGEFETGLAALARDGKPVDPLLLDRVPQPQVQQAIRQAGLSEGRFAWITQRLKEDASLRQDFQQIARQRLGPAAPGQSGQGLGQAVPRQSPQRQE